MMARWGKVDYEQFKRLKKKLEKVEKADKQAFFESAAKELAARLLGKVIRRTPVGIYPHRTGGTLRRGWTANKNQTVQAFVSSILVSRIDGAYEIEIINPVEYASYVEFGHRTSNHLGWVQGRFMLTISESELNAEKDRILERKLKRWLEEVFNGK